jgi:hypothetical protein
MGGVSVPLLLGGEWKTGNLSAMVVRRVSVLDVGELDMYLCVLEFQKWR